MGYRAGWCRLFFVALTVAGVVMAPAAAGANPPDAVGTVTCTLSGKVVFGPGLRNGGTQMTSVHVVAKMSDCTGTADGAHIVGGKLTATGTIATNDCDAFFTNNLPALQVKIKWKTIRPFRFNPSFRTFDTAQAPIGTEDGLNLTQSGSGHVTDSGSFFTEPMAMSLWIDQSVGGGFGNACAVASGVRTLTFTGINPNPSQLVVY